MNRIFIAFTLLCLLGASFVKAQDLNNASAKEQRKMKRIVAPAKFIIAASPVHVTEENIGAGLSLEIFPNTSGLFSIVLPLSYALPEEDYYSGYNSYWYTSYPGNFPNYTPPLEDQYYTYNGMLYFYPGFKIYPTGANKKVSYAAGANLVLGIGSVEKVTTQYSLDSSVNNNYTYYTRTPISGTVEGMGRYKLGILLTNSLNLRPGKHLYLGIDFGIGYSYIDRFNGMNNGTDVMAQIGVKFGFAK